jgi:hypothetical protein
MLTNFTPKENTLYGICFQTQEGWIKIYSSNDNHFYDADIESPSSYDFKDEDLWQFFKVAENSYALANYKYGTLWNLETSSDYNYVTLGSLQKETPVITPFLTNKIEGDEDWVQFAVSTTDVSGLVEAGLSEANFMRVEATSDFSFAVKEIKQNPASNSLVEINQGLEVEEPAFVNGTAPQLYPAEATIMNEVYVPYFMVNDPTMTSMADRIQQTPYYILRQYGQYEMIAQYSNGSTNENGTVTLVETYEYGWSDTVSANISAQFGFDLGGTIEENEVILKETEQLTIKLNLGLEVGVSINKSASYSKQIRAEVPSETALAIYGVTASFKLYQGNGTSAIASPNVPMKTSRKFVSITEPYPSS